VAGRCKTALTALALAAGACSAPATAAFGAAQPPLKAAPDGRPLRLTFSEDFDSLRLWNGRTGVWRPTFGDGTHKGLDRRSLPTNGELQLYVDPALADAQGPMGLDPFVVRGGVLEITAAPAPPNLTSRLNNYRYISGLITTQPSLKQTYGYFEMRAELPRGKGLWPAFWLLPADLSWPPEIDVMESIGDPGHVYMTTHSGVGPGGAAAEKTIGGGFHVFAVSWDPKSVVWYIDGAEAARQATPSDLNKPMFLLANLAVGGNWPGAPDASTAFPAKYRIDYIRAYQFAP
jgi:beta-glucanase (GH16 family)